ncbi:MAG TPA: hypothetical protein VFI47_18325 [Acidimicrobiales bacterium]|nr:hypothetical protein [Acidimicrobiales bacterium]
MLWVEVAVALVIGCGAGEMLERYAARRGASGNRVRKLAFTSGVFLGGGIALLLANLASALLLLALGAAHTTFFLLWYRRPGVGPPRTR